MCFSGFSACSYVNGESSVFCQEEVGHGWTLLIKMAEITLIDFSYLNRLAVLSFTEMGPSFHIKIQGWGQS